METIPFNSTVSLKRLAGTKACRPELVEIPEFSFPMIDGQGSPDETEFATAIETLEGLAWTIRFAHKRAGFGPVYSVPTLEGLYHVDNWAGTFRPKDLDHLIWTLMIAQPPPVATVHLEAARMDFARKKPGETLQPVRLRSLAEGLCVRELHIAPATESVTTELIHDCLEANGLMMRGRHHEIYLVDPRRAAPETLRTLPR